MANLITKLTEATQDLLQAYLEKTETYAKDKYEVMRARNNWFEKQWCEYFGIEPNVSKNIHGIERYSFPSGFYSSKNARRYSTMRDEASTILRKYSLSMFIEVEKKKTEEHYDASISKLAVRMLSKHRSEEFELTHQRLGVNFEILAKHKDGSTTKAWTIIAEGPIKRPHYRFLVK